MSYANRFVTGPPVCALGGRFRWWSQRLALVTLALLSLDLAGCSGLQPRDPCSTSSAGCGGGSGAFTRFRDRFLRRSTPVVVTEGSGCVGTPMMGAIVGSPTPMVTLPSTVTVPPTVTVPGPGAPRVLTPAPSGGPVIDPDVPNLEEIPSNPPVGSLPAQPRNGATPKTNYQTSRDSSYPRASRQGGLAQAKLNPEPARRPARQAPGPEIAQNPHPLDHLPPLPREAAGSAPLVISATTEGSPSQPPAPLDPSAIPSRVLADRTEPNAGLDAAARTDDLPETAAVGIKRYRILDTGLAGGDFPTSDGLAWLHDKGYRTLVDLRDPSEVQQSEVDDIARHGLRHVRIPINPKTLDPQELARFETLLTESSARPLFFCDSDGNRAGLVWYLHRIATDKMAADMASREAEQIGLTDARLYFFASEYLKRLIQPTTPATAPTSGAAAPAASTQDGVLKTGWMMQYTAPVVALLSSPLAY